MADSNMKRLNMKRLNMKRPSMIRLSVKGECGLLGEPTEQGRSRDGHKIGEALGIRFRETSLPKVS